MYHMDELKGMLVNLLQMLLFLQTKEEVFAPKMTRSSAMQSRARGGYVTSGNHITFEFQGQRAES